MFKRLGVLMSLMMMLFACGGGVLKTKTFSWNETWVAPASTISLASVVGRGVNGTPDTTYQDADTYVLDTYSYFIYDDGSEFTNPTLASTSPATATSTVPGEFCYPPTPYTADGHYNRRTCYFYDKRTVPGDSGGTPGTTGASATGFGLTFPGGVNGTASTYTHNNVAVTPLGPYPIVVPAGATLTITYYE